MKTILALLVLLIAVPVLRAQTYTPPAINTYTDLFNEVQRIKALPAPTTPATKAADLTTLLTPYMTGNTIDTPDTTVAQKENNLAITGLAEAAGMTATSNPAGATRTFLEGKLAWDAAAMQAYYAKDWTNAIADETKAITSATTGGQPASTLQLLNVRLLFYQVQAGQKGNADLLAFVQNSTGTIAPPVAQYLIDAFQPGAYIKAGTPAAIKAFWQALCLSMTPNLTVGSPYYQAKLSLDNTTAALGQ